MATYPVCLGIDPGLECTGWCLLAGSRRCHGYGGIKSDAKLSDSERIVQIENCLRSILNKARTMHVITVASVEQYVYQGEHSKSLNAFRVSRLVGSVETLLRTEGLRVTGFTRGEGLQAIGVPHNAAESVAKKAIQRWVKAMGGEMPSNEHSRAAYAQAWRAQSVLARRSA
jgi:Holliday junction resolvasome RuvABC endonuclease subunit